MSLLAFGIVITGGRPHQYHTDIIPDLNKFSLVSNSGIKSKKTRLGLWMERQDHDADMERQGQGQHGKPLSIFSFLGSVLIFASNKEEYKD